MIGYIWSTLSSPRWMVGYLVALTVAESVTTLAAPQVGLVFHGLILMALLLHAALAIKLSQRRFLLALTLAPLIRLLSLSLPLHHFPIVYWYLVIGVPLSIATMLTFRIAGINRNLLGLNWRALPVQIVVGMFGIGLGYVDYLILRPEPLVGDRWGLIWLPALILLVFTGFLEEVIYRGLMQHTAVKYMGRSGILYTAAVFAVLHIGHRSVLNMIFVFGVALFFGYVTQRTGSILGVALCHGLMNIAMFLVFPFLIAGPPPG